MVICKTNKVFRLCSFFTGTDTLFGTVSLLFDQDDKIAYQAAWVMNHYSLWENQWLYDKQNELIDEAIVCKHTGKRRLILSLLYRQPLTNPPRVDFLDFCLERMISKKEPSGVQALCMKLAYELCRPIPELIQELGVALDMIAGESSPAIQSARKNILKAMISGKSLQTIELINPTIKPIMKTLIPLFMATVIVFGLSVCKSSKPAVADRQTDITGKYWKLIEIQGKPVENTEGREPHILLNTDNTFVGSGGVSKNGKTLSLNKARMAPLARFELDDSK